MCQHAALGRSRCRAAAGAELAHFALPCAAPVCVCGITGDGCAPGVDGEAAGDEGGGCRCIGRLPLMLPVDASLGCVQWICALGVSCG